MIYLTADHNPAPRVLVHGGTQYPVASMIARDDTTGLAALGIYPHVTLEGSAPLGYTDWTLADGVYSREPAGTPAERDAAALEQYRASLYASPLACYLVLRDHTEYAGTHENEWAYLSALRSQMTEVDQAYMDKAQNWRRLDARVIAFSEAMGYPADVLDARFAAARVKDAEMSSTNA